MHISTHMHICSDWGWMSMMVMRATGPSRQGVGSTDLLTIDRFTAMSCESYMWAMSREGMTSLFTMLCFGQHIM